MTRSESDTHGRSSSTGTSESEGTNSSVNSGRSWGVNSSEGQNFNWSSGRNWTYGGFLGGKRWQGGNEGKSKGRSYTEGKSKGWTEGKSEGVSHGTSRSRTDGTSDSRTTGVSETDGTTHGSSKSRTSGASETIQKRALITPDEIGQVFARIDDRERLAYPGLALAIISGARPVVLRRVNYYEDFQFAGLFDPHPDHAPLEVRTLLISGEDCGESIRLFDPDGAGLKLAGWLCGPGAIVRPGQPVGVIARVETQVASLLAPMPGRFKAVTAEFTPGPLFHLEYYDDGTGHPVDPFAEVREYRQKFKKVVAAQQATAALAETRRMARTGAAAFWVLAGMALLWLMASPSAGVFLVLLALTGGAIWMGRRSARLTGEIDKPRKAKSHTRQLYESYNSRSRS
jgi:hypothetical protein